jgi:hypothetical protein
MSIHADSIDINEQLRSENAVLRAEVAKWKNESVIDANTVYSLSCQLAQRTGEVRELAGLVDDLSSLAARVAVRLAFAAPDDDLPGQVWQLLKRKGLQAGSMLALVEGRLS